MPEYLKIPELADRLDVSEKTARNYVKNGVIPSKFVGGAYRVSEKDLDEYLQRSEVKPGPKAQTPPPPEEVAGSNQEWAKFINEWATDLEEWAHGLHEGGEPAELPERTLLTYVGGVSVALDIFLRLQPTIEQAARENEDEALARAWRHLSRSMMSMVTPALEEWAEQQERQLTGKDKLPDNVTSLLERMTG